MDFQELLKMPTITGRDGIHISAQLRIDAMQLENHRIAWAASTMERAAKHIDALERLLLSGPVTKQEANAVTEGQVGE